MYLDPWVSSKIKTGASSQKIYGGYPPLTRENLDFYIQNKRWELLAFLMEKSPFYQEHLAEFRSSIKGYGFDIPIVGNFDIGKILNQWENIPFTSAADLINQGEQMLCIHPSHISRIVSQTTSGTTGQPKRIYFTPQDQELARDYFHYGMKIMVSPGDSILILLPHKSPGSLGFLLQEGLGRLDAIGFFKDSIEGSLNNDSANFNKISAIVGPPSLIVAMTKEEPEIRPHSVLMTADFVAEEDRRAVKEAWGSRVFEHYGTTEMGLGCAMSCRDTEDHPPVGYHVRENDLYIEIIDPDSGKLLPQGQWGEIVVTTLTRKGMPFLRYRTGDRSRLLKDPCSCGSLLKRLDRVQKRPQSKNISE